MSLLTIFCWPVLGSQQLNNAEALYESGINCRNAQQYEQAIPFFMKVLCNSVPLNLRTKAQHNLGSCHFHLGQQDLAYKWFKQASDNTFKASSNNLLKLNLFDAILPFETVVHIASELGMQDLMNFGQASKRIRSVQKSILFATDFLDSPYPYARDILRLFDGVTFTPQPQAIRLIKELNLANSKIEIHFRDSEHLRKLGYRVPLIEAASITYVRNPLIKEDEEFIFSNCPFKEKIYINLVSDKPLKIVGDLVLPLNNFNKLMIPLRSNYRNLNFKGNALKASSLNALDNAKAIASMINDFDQMLFDIRTKDAFNLMSNIKNKRIAQPSLFPALTELSQDIWITTDREIKLTQRDYLCASGSFIYAARSHKELDALKLLLPYFISSTPIHYVDSNLEDDGVYSVGPLKVVSGHDITTAGNIIMTGNVMLINYNFSINAGGSIWLYGLNLKAHSIEFNAEGEIIQHALHSRLQDFVKPDRIPLSMWNEFIKHLKGKIIR